MGIMKLVHWLAHFLYTILFCHLSTQSGKNTVTWRIMHGRRNEKLESTHTGEWRWIIHKRSIENMLQKFTKSWSPVPEPIFSHTHLQIKHLQKHRRPQDDYNTPDACLERVTERKCMTAVCEELTGSAVYTASKFELARKCHIAIHRFSTVWLFCRSPMPPMQWCFLSGGTRSTARRLKSEYARECQKDDKVETYFELAFTLHNTILNKNKN